MNTVELVQVTSLVRAVYDNPAGLFNNLVALGIETAQIKALAEAHKIGFYDAAVVLSIEVGLAATQRGAAPAAVVDPTWTKHTVVSIRHYTSSTGNPTWECKDDKGNVLYIRQSNKQMWLANYAALEEMALGDVWDAVIECYSLPGKDAKFVEVQHVSAGGTLTKPAPKIVLNERQRKVVEWAVFALKNPHVTIFDTETTGLGEEDEIVQIAVVLPDETVAYESLIKPQAPERLLMVGKDGKRPVDIHGITLEDVAGAPDMRDVLDDLRKVMDDKHWLGYNVEYDKRLLIQTQSKALIAKADYLHEYEATFPGHCVMNKYAEFVGEAGWQKGSYRWWSLDEACKAMKVKTDDLKPHSAAGDAIATLRLLKALAALDDGHDNKDNIPF